MDIKTHSNDDENPQWEALQGRPCIQLLKSEWQREHNTALRQARAEI